MSFIPYPFILHPGHSQGRPQLRGPGDLRAFQVRHTHTHIRTHIHTHIHTRTHTHIYTHTHTPYVICYAPHANTPHTHTPIRHTPHTTRHTPHATHHTPHATHHTPHTTHHTPHTTHHTPLRFNPLTSHPVICHPYPATGCPCLKPNYNTVFLTYLHTTYVSFIPYLPSTSDWMPVPFMRVNPILKW
jgi:hypothetical protein